MLEILLMRGLLRAIGRMLREKGKSPLGYQFLAAFLWIGCEIGGFVIGFANDMGNGAYLLGLMGAATGAAAGYMIAASVKPDPSAQELGQVFD